MFIVLAPVHENFSGPNLFLHVRHNQFGVFVFEQLRQRVGKSLGRFVVSWSVEWNINLPVSYTHLDVYKRQTLVWLANLAAIELHPSLSLAEDITCPTMMVFDLDPGPPANILQCCQVGLWLRAVFEHFELQSFPKTSGSKGLQIYVPLNTPTNYEATKMCIRDSPDPAGGRSGIFPECSDTSVSAV